MLYLPTSVYRSSFYGFLHILKLLPFGTFLAKETSYTVQRGLPSFKVFSGTGIFSWTERTILDPCMGQAVAIWAVSFLVGANQQISFPMNIGKCITISCEHVQHISELYSIKKLADVWSKPNSSGQTWMNWHPEACVLNLEYDYTSFHLSLIYFFLNFKSFIFIAFLGRTTVPINGSCFLKQS